MKPRLSVVGLGKLGACMAACFAGRGYQVMGVDVLSRPVDLVNQGLPPVKETGLAELMQRCRGAFRATTDISDAILHSDITFIVVPTPSTEDGSFSPDLVLEAGGHIGRALRHKEGWHLVVLTSTVMPGSTENELRPLLERESGKRCGLDFGLCYSPEFIALGSVIRDLLNPDFVLIGESDARSGDRLEQLYASILERPAPVARMAPVNAELAKLAVNTYVSAKIAFANTLAQVCETLPGADIDVVTAAIGLDARIVSRYLKGGMPFGGPCFPRDVEALARLALTHGVEPHLPRGVAQANRARLEAIAARISAVVPPGCAISILGLAYKPGTAVLDGSPSVALAAELLSQGFKVTLFDHQIADMPQAALPAGCTLAATAARAIRNAGAVVIAHDDPSLLPPEALRDLERASIAVFDCWRVLPGHENALSGLDHIGAGVTP